MITESKLKDGKLTLGEGLALLDASCQPTNIRIVPGYEEDGDRVEVLCGDVLEPDTTRTNTLAINAIQDFTDPDGLVHYSWDHDLEKVPFVWYPRGEAEPGYGGTVEVRALEVGGDVNKRLTTETEWKIVGDVARLAAVGP